MDLNKVVRETLSLVEHQFAQVAMKTELSLDDNIALVKGSPGKLQQVFLNLFLNARDAMESGGTLTIETRQANGAVRVSVRDTGAGIAAENLARIFDPFFTTKGAKKGTGLGLSVSYGIVREHGGDITVQSQSGRGTQFLLTFPIGVKAVTPPAPTRTEAPRVASPAVAAASAVATIRTESPSVPAAISAKSPSIIGRTTEPGAALGIERSDRLEGGAGPVRPDRFIQ